MFSLITATAALSSSWTDRLPSGSRKNACSRRQLSLKYFSFLPGMILSSIASGLPSLRSLARSVFISFSSSSGGTSSRRKYFGSLQAICMAMSFTSAWNFSLRAVKSVSQLISTSTPILPPRWMYDPTAPSVALRPAFFPAVARPFSRSQVMAFSTSPPDSSSAFLQSIIPAPVFSRRSFTIADVTSAIAELLLGLRFAAFGRRLAAGQRRLVLHDRTRRRLRVGAHHRAPLATATSARSAAAAIAPAAPLGRAIAVLAVLAFGLLRLAGVVGLVARLALDGRVRDLAAEQPDGADGVVVAGDDVVDALGIAIGIDQRDDGDAESRRLMDGDVLLLRVDDEEAAGKPRHLLDSAQVLLQLLHLVLEQRHFLLGQLLEGAVGRHLLQRLQAIDAALDGLEVGQRAAQPAIGDVELAGARRLLDHRVLRLLLGADEEHGPAAGADVADELEGLAREPHGLLQIDDVDAVAGAEDVRLHLRVPALGLVAEVDAGLEQLAHGDALAGLDGLLHAGRVRAG